MTRAGALVKGPRGEAPLLLVRCERRVFCVGSNDLITPTKAGSGAIWSASLHHDERARMCEGRAGLLVARQPDGSRTGRGLPGEGGKLRWEDILGARNPARRSSSPRRQGPWSGEEGSDLISPPHLLSLTEERRNRQQRRL